MQYHYVAHRGSLLPSLSGLYRLEHATNFWMDVPAALIWQTGFHPPDILDRFDSLDISQPVATLRATAESPPFSPINAAPIVSIRQIGKGAMTTLMAILSCFRIGQFGSLCGGRTCLTERRFGDSRSRRDSMPGAPLPLGSFPNEIWVFLLIGNLKNRRIVTM